MTAAKRRPATPVSQASKRAATKDDTQESPIDTPADQELPKPPKPAPADSAQQAPVDTAASQGPKRAVSKDSAEEAPTKDAGGEPAPPTETGQVDPEDRATTQSPGRSPFRHPERVWPD